MFSYGNQRTTLAGPDATRRLESNSGAMRREVRRLRREGFNKAAEQMAMGASQMRLSEIPQEGPRWKSYETKMAESAFANQQQAMDNRNAARLARVSNMQLAADEKRLSGYLNPSSSGTAATGTTTPAATTTPVTGVAATSTGVAPLDARTKAILAEPTYNGPTLVDSLYGSTAAQEALNKQGIINRKAEGQFAYDERQRLRDLGINKGPMGSAETTYWKFLQEEKDLAARDRIKKRASEIAASRGF